MDRTIFILGTDPDHCTELRELLQERISDRIVTPTLGEAISGLKETDTIILSGEERNIGVMYRHLLNRLEEQVNRAKVLGELVRLSITSLSLEDILDKVVAKSTEVLADTAFIVLESEEKYRLEAAYCADQERLKRMLMTAVNISPQAVASELLRVAMEKGGPVVISNLHDLKITPDLRSFIDKHGLFSLIAAPIRSKDRILGAFISMSTPPRMLTDQDVASAMELADFTAMVIENARLVAELQRSATTDPLTGVYNTRFFHEVLNREAARSKRYRTTLSLLMIDVDSFKAINDTYGHVVGDKLLVQIGRVLNACVRTTDLVFRCGGDEFGVVLPGTSAEGAMHVAEKILSLVQSGDILETLGYSGRTSVSIGIAEYRHGSPSENMVADADHALYDSKRSGKNTVRIFGKTR
ncbi:MAG TPA: sensor domain-containing diguanylate cyclase [Terriglobia bacterium]|nr:sensor domain-containing diguanylate cyclase [Terriglobia bacterium]